MQFIQCPSRTRLEKTAEGEQAMANLHIVRWGKRNAQCKCGRTASVYVVDSTFKETRFVEFPFCYECLYQYDIPDPMTDPFTRVYWSLTGER